MNSFIFNTHHPTNLKFSFFNAHPTNLKVFIF